MPDDSSDILGGRLRVSQHGSPRQVPPFLWLGIALFSLYLVIRYGIPQYRQWRDQAHRKGVRRRYGIPDSDHRPFNVAYASVYQGQRREPETEDQLRPRRSEPLQQAFRPASTMDGSYMRHRAHHSSDHRNITIGVGTSAAGSSMQQGTYPSTSYSAPAVDYASDLPAQAQNDAHDDVPTSATMSQSSSNDVLAASMKINGKHDRDEEPIPFSDKKSRVSKGRPVASSDDEIDDSERSDIGMEVDEEALEPPKRGSKRSANVDDDESIEAIRANGRDKRARKVSRETASELSDLEMYDEDMDADELGELEPISRGKKRDRDEAGSTFGGDGSMTDDDNDEGDGKSRRHRKRRTVWRKNLDTASRGQKRGRDVEAFDSDEDSDRPKRRDTRKKRGKKGHAPDNLTVDAPLSVDPLCKGRRIGEKWEVNGVRFKVGPNGQRLRQELVKKSRSRFPMPKDSQHPDRRANLDIYVEVWLSEEEYNAAKERNELAWQDSPLDLVEPSTPGDIPDSPTRAGKNLLWMSTNTLQDSPVPSKGPFRQSIAANVSLRINPFQQSMASPARRVSSVYQVTVPPTPDSPKLKSSRSYSKWEKQDLEAAAMSKIREKAQMEATQAAEAKKAVTPSAAALASVPAPGPLPASSSLTFGKPAEQLGAKNDQKPVASSLFSAPLTIGSSTSSPLTSNIPTAAAAAGAAQTSVPSISFSLPPAPITGAAKDKPTGPATFTFGPSSSSTPTATPQGSAVGGPAPSAGPLSQTSASGNSVTSTNFSGGSMTPFGAPSVGSSAASTTKPTLSFAVPSGINTSESVAKGAEQGKATQTLSGPSSLNRLGGTSTTATPGSIFSFGKPAASDTTGPANTVPAAPSSSDANTSSAPGALKFSFGVSGKTSSTTSVSAPGPAATPVPATPAATGGDATKPTFAFGVSSAPAPSTSTPASTPTTKPTFSFGNTSQANTSTTLGTTTNPLTAPKSAFSLGTPGSSSSSTLSTTPMSLPASGSIFGGASSTNNAAPSTTGPSQSTFKFGLTGGSTATPVFSSSTTPSASASTSAPKPAITFGTTSSMAPSNTTALSSTAGETQKPALSFNFGGTGTSAFGAPTAAASPFGNVKQSPSAFGFPNPPSSSSAPSPFTFGSSNANQNSKQ
ncbi:uncharacterized protein FIBRA_01421 [Fibroporia radiculosa]|uniref:Uncharacterized protein n=1 Tax=Fibroporia radiculosa TaxID=599839 RepID=J4G0Z3_9APHY|nr:uncharacterized protein FIBRA_01421 [Fibroporia radiculosa]CCL99403.1 predicted protein [Fibroporia radiculosa]